jgi:2-polyprenyl-3-methyl-5-hydroxy-6-metoxy-1,4-benzoquinol methylase
MNLRPRRHSSYEKIVAVIGERRKVLDVGCHTGYLAQLLKARGCEVVGLEIDAAAAEVAKKFCDEVILADAETIDRLAGYSEGYFDAIVYADVLEHFRNPGRPLRTFKKYLSQDGIVVASIPNVANWRIRLSLLCGIFEYAEYGILDRNHLKFYTMKTAKKLFKESGYTVARIECTELGSKVPVLPTLLGYQFILVGKQAELA